MVAVTKYIYDIDVLSTSTHHGHLHELSAVAVMLTEEKKDLSSIDAIVFLLGRTLNGK